MYNYNNIFALILKNEIPCNKVFESDNTLAFHDINPISPIHIIVIPKHHYIDASDFHKNAPSNEILDFYHSIQKICDKLEIDEYRIVSNIGGQAGQCVFHYHMHILSGTKLGSFS